MISAYLRTALAVLTAFVLTPTAPLAAQDTSATEVVFTNVRVLLEDTRN